MCLILDSIICSTTAAIGGRPVIQSGCLIARSVCTDCKPSYAANDIMEVIKEHMFEKSVRRTCNGGPGCRWSAPLVVGQLFTIVLSRVGAGVRPLIKQMPFHTERLLHTNQTLEDVHQGVDPLLGPLACQGATGVAVPSPVHPPSPV